MAIALDFLKNPSKHIRSGDLNTRTRYKDLLVKLNDCHRHSGLLQHHDAITGTSYSDTIKDIVHKMDVTYQKFLYVFEPIFSEKMSALHNDYLEFKQCEHIENENHVCSLIDKLNMKTKSV